MEEISTMATSDKPTGRPVDAARLEDLGKQAAKLAAVNGLSLTEAAVQVLNTEKLSAAQVRRAVEQCNTYAVNGKFASLSGVDRIVHIDGGPADPEQVLACLKLSAAPRGAHINALEYTIPPSREKSASATSSVKLAAAEDLSDLRDKLAAAHEELDGMAEASSWRMEDALDLLRGAVKTAVLEGAYVAELYAAWAPVSPTMAKVAAAQFRNEYGWGHRVEGRAIASDHPVMQHFEAFAKCADTYYMHTTARKDVEGQLARVESHLRRAS
jgi:hypothetical protein